MHNLPSALQTIAEKRLQEAVNSLSAAAVNWCTPSGGTNSSRSGPTEALNASATIRQKIRHRGIVAALVYVYSMLLTDTHG
jgi:hypothetical protein